MGKRRTTCEKVVTYKENGGVSDKDFIKEHDLKKKGAAEKEEKKEKVEEKPVAVESMLKTGHSYIDKRCARLFGKRLVLGTIVGWLPACKLEDVGALFRVVHGRRRGGPGGGGGGGGGGGLRGAQAEGGEVAQGGPQVPRQAGRPLL